MSKSKTSAKAMRNKRNPKLMDIADDFNSLLPFVADNLPTLPFVGKYQTILAMHKHVSQFWETHEAVLSKEHKSSVAFCTLLAVGFLRAGIPLHCFFEGADFVSQAAAKALNTKQDSHSQLVLLLKIFRGDMSHTIAHYLDVKLDFTKQIAPQLMQKNILWQTQLRKLFADPALRWCVNRYRSLDQLRKEKENSKGTETKTQVSLESMTESTEPRNDKSPFTADEVLGVLQDASLLAKELERQQVTNLLFEAIRRNNLPLKIYNNILKHGLGPALCDNTDVEYVKDTLKLLLTDFVCTQRTIPWTRTTDGNCGYRVEPTAEDMGKVSQVMMYMSKIVTTASLLDEAQDINTLQRLIPLLCCKEEAWENQYCADLKQATPIEDGDAPMACVLYGIVKTSVSFTSMTMKQQLCACRRAFHLLFHEAEVVVQTFGTKHEDLRWYPFEKQLENIIPLVLGDTRKAASKLRSNITRGIDSQCIMGLSISDLDDFSSRVSVTLVSKWTVAYSLEKRIRLASTPSKPTSCAEDCDGGSFTGLPLLHALQSWCEREQDTHEQRTGRSSYYTGAPASESKTPTETRAHRLLLHVVKAPRYVHQRFFYLCREHIFDLFCDHESLLCDDILLEWKNRMKQELVFRQSEVTQQMSNCKATLEAMELSIPQDPTDFEKKETELQRELLTERLNRNTKLQGLRDAKYKVSKEDLLKRAEGRKLMQYLLASWDTIPNCVESTLVSQALGGRLISIRFGAKGHEPVVATTDRLKLSLTQLPQGMFLVWPCDRACQRFSITHAFLQELLESTHREVDTVMKRNALPEEKDQNNEESHQSAGLPTSPQILNLRQ